MSAHRILLVEDNPVTRKLVRFVLQNADEFELHEAGDAATALELAEAHPPDLILLDLVLPGMDGFELAVEFGRRPTTRHVHVLAFSGLSQLDEARVAAAGFAECLIKPVEPSRLLRTVRAHLPPATPQPHAIGRGQRIVLADDDDVQRKLVAFRLRRAGFEVEDVPDGQAALAAARRTPPAIIVTDVMMPNLDGFQVCAAARRDPRLEDVPIVLTTSTYVESEDRELGTRAGANAFVVRTPDLQSLFEAIDSVLRLPVPTTTAGVLGEEQFERERSSRVVKQLERQVALTARASQQCATLSAELTIVNAMSEALTHNEHIDSVLRDTLAACLDAAGVSVGALYLPREGGFTAHTVGSAGQARLSEVESFFGEPGLLEALMARRTVTVMRDDWNDDDPRIRALLGRLAVRSALLVPLVAKNEVFGALLMLSQQLDLTGDSQALFAEAVGNQISVALSLARAFEERARSERAAREHAKLLDSVFSTISDPIVVVDDRGRVTGSNAAAQALFGVPPDGALGSEVEQAFHHPDRRTPLAEHERPLARALAGETVERLEVFLRNAQRPDETFLDVTARPLRDEGRIYGAVAVCRDVTLEKRAYEQLAVSDRLASIGMMAASVGHEINNPLACVVANVEMAVDDLAALARRHEGMDLGELPDELREAAEGADRVRQIVRDLKIFSRGDDDKREAVDVERVLDSSIRMAWNEIRHRARVVRHYGQVPAVEAAESRLGQVFLNLIVNAAQAIAPGRADENTITVTTRVGDEGHIVVEVQDTGAGIPPEVMHRLFTPFVTTKPIGVGTGLGLAICRRLVTGMGGDIAAESEVARGTIFRVTLPRVAESAEAVAEPPARPRSAATAAALAHILVVDDDAAVGLAVRRALRDGHEVTVTTSGADALTRIAGGARFDAILCDVMMPVMTGDQLHTELMRIAPEQAAAMVFLSGGVFSPRVHAFLESVPNRRLEKPFDVQTLRAAVEDLLRPRTP